MCFDEIVSAPSTAAVLGGSVSESRGPRSPADLATLHGRLTALPSAAAGRRCRAHVTAFPPSGRDRRPAAPAERPPGQSALRAMILRAQE
jgi:hypothetical protein